MNLLRISTLIMGLIYVFMARNTLAGCLDTSDVPLETRIVSAPPNIMFVLDNSGSMDWEFMTDDNAGKFEGNIEYLFDDPGDNNYQSGSSSTILSGSERGKWKSQWAGLNRIYYNPAVNYQPWPNMANASKSAPRSNPAKETPTFDLTAEFYRVGSTPVSIKNAHYYTWDDVDADGELDSGENVYLVNFVQGVRAYYRLNDRDGDDTVESGELISISESDLPDRVRPKVHDEKGNFVRYKTDEEDLQNFANWYSFYRRRELAAKAAVANVIRGLAGVQVGFYSINSGLRQTVLPVKVDMGERVIVDNQDSGYQESGNWAESNAQNEYNNSSRYAQNAGDYATWTPSLPETAAYNVYVWWNYWTTRDTNALYTINHAGGTQAVRVNQQENYGKWTLLGTFQFNAGTSGSVTLTRDNQSTGLSTNADAVMFEKVGGSGKVDETDTLLSNLYSLDSDGGTPLRNALKAVGQYYHQDDGETGGLGNSPYASAVDGGACQQSFAIVMTDGYYNGTGPGVGNQDEQEGVPYADSYSDTLADVAMKYYREDLSYGLEDEVPTSSCDNARHQHMVTYTLSFGVRGTLRPVDNNNDGEIDDPCFLSSATPIPSWPDPQGGNPQKIDDLWHTAVNGRGVFYGASNSKDLIGSLKVLFKNIVSRAASGASASVNGEELSTNTVLYQASYDSKDWTGDVTAYPVDPATGEILRDIDEVLWHASDELQSIGWTNRNIVTYDGTSGGIPFRLGNLTSVQKSALDMNWQTDPVPAQNIVDYVRGKEVNGFRPRTKKLGDIVHSAPLLVGKTIFVGGNDGMIHAFNAENGAERFAYVPNLVFENLKFLKANDYQHKFYVDLTPVAVSNVGPNAITLLVGGLGRGGAGYFALDVSNADSVNSASAETSVADMVMWEYPRPGNRDDDLGYSYSRAFIVKSNAGGHEWVVIFGNGYDSLNGHAVLYILDLEGNVIKKLDTGAGGCNGLSTASLVDVNADRRVDYAYAGDLKGNLWKFDLTGSDPADWAVAFDDGTVPQPLFQATGQPITIKPDVMRHPEKEGYIVVFGTGKYLAADDRSDVGIQSIYGIWDYGDDEDNREYLGSFNKATGGLSNQSGNITLLKQTEIDFRTVSGQDVRTLSNNVPNWETISDPDSGQNDNPGSEACNDGQDNDSDGLTDEADECIAHAGWYFDLTMEGERIIKDPVIRDEKAIVISYIPTDSACSGGGDSFVFEMDAGTGGRLLLAQFDITNDRLIDEQDLINIGTIQNPLWAAPTGMAFTGILNPPAILRMPDRKTEMKVFSSSAGVAERLFEAAEKRGISYWRER